MKLDRFLIILALETLLEQVKDAEDQTYADRINKEIRFNALHFQGGAKRHIKDAYERCERSMEI